MKKSVLIGMVIVLLTASSVLATPWTQQFFQVTVPEMAFNFVEGFNVGGQGFSATPVNGIGAFSDPTWRSERVNQYYVRAWGSSEVVLEWKTAFDGGTYEGKPMNSSIYWFFYNMANLSAPPRPQDCIGLLTYYTLYNPDIPPPLNPWQVWSSSRQQTFGDMPNSYVDPQGEYSLATLSSDTFAEARGVWTFPTDRSTAPVPEPGTVVLLSLGILTLVTYGKRRQAWQF